MNIVLLYSLTITAPHCYGAKLDKESFQPIYDLLPDTLWKQVQGNYEKYGKNAYYHIELVTCNSLAKSIILLPKAFS